MSATLVTTLADHRAFAAQVAKEDAAVEWATRQSTDEQGQSRRRVRQRRTRDGQAIFVVSCFDGNKPRRTDLLALDARAGAEFGVEEPEKNSLQYRLRQLKGMSKSRSEPCFTSKGRRHDGPTTPFRVAFPLPPKGPEMRKETARDQAELFVPRPETVALSPAEKRALRTWGLDVDGFLGADGSRPPRWVTAVGNTNNKWANRDMSIRAPREEQEFLEKLLASGPRRKSAAGVLDPINPSMTPPPLPRWVKDLPPVRNGREQLATRKIIPFLDQHVYPEGGVAEAKRRRHREKKEFYTSLAVNAAAANSAAAAAGAARRSQAGSLSRTPSGGGREGGGTRGVVATGGGRCWWDDYDTPAAGGGAVILGEGEAAPRRRRRRSGADDVGRRSRGRRTEERGGRSTTTTTTTTAHPRLVERSRVPVAVGETPTAVTPTAVTALMAKSTPAATPTPTGSVAAKAVEPVHLTPPPALGDQQEKTRQRTERLAEGSTTASTIIDGEGCVDRERAGGRRERAPTSTSAGEQEHQQDRCSGGGGGGSGVNGNESSRTAPNGRISAPWDCEAERAGRRSLLSTSEAKANERESGQKPPVVTSSVRVLDMGTITASE